MNTTNYLSADFQGYTVRGGFAAGFKVLECQAQLTMVLAVATQS